MIRQLSFLISLLFFAGVAGFFTFCSDKKQVKQEEMKAPVQYAAHKPGVQYTGTKSCISCHQEYYETFRHTGHGKSFYEPDPNDKIEDFSKAIVYDAPSGLYYRAYWQGPEMFISEYRLNGKDTTHYRREKVDFVIGSGNQTRTYIREQNSYFFEMPITWYAKRKIWDMSPGYEGGNNSRFNRVIGDMCMNCHNSEQQFVPNSINKFNTLGRGMSCEKCHGPGEEHVKLMQAGKIPADKSTIDYSIVNPGKLPIQLQFDVCRQCHLEGITVPKDGKDVTDYRPGIPLTEYYDVFLPVADNKEQFGFASHAERLQMSPCFIQSEGKLNCTTCHDPHKPLPKNQVLFYNEKCLSCHEFKDCGLEHTKMASAGNNCAGCHMPKSGTTDIPHVSSTDHFIRKNPGKNPDSGASGNGLVTFKSFTSDTKPGDRAHVLANLIYFEQQDRNKGYLERISQYIGNLDVDNRVKYAYLNGTDLPRDLKALQPAQVNSPYTASYIAEINRQLKRPSIAWAERAVSLAPDNIEFRSQLAQVQYETGKVSAAKSTHEKIIRLLPDHKKSLASLGYIYLLEGDFSKATELTKRAIASDPDYLLPQENLVTIYLQQSDYRKGLDQLEKLIARHPQNTRYKELRERIKQEM